MFVGFTLAVGLLAAPNLAASPSSEGKRVLITDLRCDPSLKESAREITNFLAGEFAQIEGLTTASFEDVREMVENKRIKAALGCLNDDCFLDLGRSLSARYLLHGTLRTRGSGLLVSLTLLDTQTGAASARANQVLPRDPEQLFDALRAAAINLVAGFDTDQSAKPISRRTLSRLRFAQTAKTWDLSLGLATGPSLKSDDSTWVSTPLTQARMGLQRQLSGALSAGLQLDYTYLTAKGYSTIWFVDYLDQVILSDRSMQSLRMQATDLRLHVGWRQPRGVWALFARASTGLSYIDLDYGTSRPQRQDLPYMFNWYSSVTEGWNWLAATEVGVDFIIADGLSARGLLNLTHYLLDLESRIWTVHETGQVVELGGGPLGDMTAVRVGLELVWHP